MSGESWPTDTTRPQNVFVMPPVPSPFILTLPLPPSVNTMTYKLGNRSSSVQAWIKSAGRYVLAMKPLPPTMIEPFQLRIVWPEIDAGKWDCDNRVKPLLDYLQRIELIANDKLCRRLLVEFGYVPRGFCRVEISVLP